MKTVIGSQQSISKLGSLAADVIDIISATKSPVTIIASLSADFTPIRHAIITYTGVVRSVAEQFGTKTSDPFQSSVLKLRNPLVEVADAAALIRDSAMPFGFRVENVSDGKNFTVEVVNADSVGFVVKGVIENGTVKANSMSILVA